MIRRDTRRGIGLDQFRLTYPPLNYFNESNPAVGYRFNDTIALGNYNDDTHEMLICDVRLYETIYSFLDDALPCSHAERFHAL